MTTQDRCGDGNDSRSSSITWYLMCTLCRLCRLRPLNETSRRPLPPHPPTPPRDGDPWGPLVRLLALGDRLMLSTAKPPPRCLEPGALPGRPREGEEEARAEAAAAGWRRFGELAEGSRNWSISRYSLSAEAKLLMEPSRSRLRPCPSSLAAALVPLAALDACETGAPPSLAAPGLRRSRTSMR